MSIDEIMGLHVGNRALSNSVLFLWTTDPMLPTSIAVGQAWGFTYKTIGFVWTKLTRTGKRWHTGMGHWTRSNPEYCLLMTRGAPARLSRSVHKIIEAPVREHSRKPDEVYDRIEALVGGPYLELFARHRRPGWTQWGEQLPPDPLP